MENYNWKISENIQVVNITGSLQSTTSKSHENVSGFELREAQESVGAPLSISGLNWTQLELRSFITGALRASEPLILWLENNLMT